MDYKKLGADAREACGCTTCKVVDSEFSIRPTSCLAPRILEQMRFDIRLDDYNTEDEFDELDKFTLAEEEVIPTPDHVAEVFGRELDGDLSEDPYITVCLVQGHDWNGGTCYTCKTVYSEACDDDKHEWRGSTSCFNCNTVIDPNS